MTTPKASGPLWADLGYDGILDAWRSGPIKSVSGEQHPCRLLPGHGKMVPVELVQAIDNWYVENGCTGSRFGVLKKLIDVALEGAI